MISNIKGSVEATSRFVEHVKLIELILDVDASHSSALVFLLAPPLSPMRILVRSLEF